MPRVLFVAPSAYPLGGVAVWLDYLIKGLPDYSWSPTLGLVSGRWHDVERYAGTYPGLPWVGIGNPTGSAEGRRRSLAATIRRGRPDVVVGVNIADVYEACRVLRSQGISYFRTAMSIHGIAADMLGDLERERGVIDAVIGTNRLICRLCSELAGMPEERVLYAPYGVNTHALDTGMPGQHSVTGPLRIAYVGRLERDQKCVEIIPEILRWLEERHIDFQIVIAGDGRMREELSQSLSPWLANGRAEMLGAVPPEYLGERVYARADALLVTSSWETGPIVIWEAMAAGVPVVTSRYIGSGLEGALEHGENCLMFPVGGAREAARQLGELTRAGVAEKLVKNARNLVASRYSIEKSVQAWAQALDEIATIEVRNEVLSTGVPRCAGRLDRLFGTRGAETVRRCLGVSFTHRSAGGEWPHSLSDRANDPGFFEAAGRLDRP